MAPDFVDGTVTNSSSSLTQARRRSPVSCGKGMARHMPAAGMQVHLCDHDISNQHCSTTGCSLVTNCGQGNQITVQVPLKRVDTVGEGSNKQWGESQSQSNIDKVLQHQHDEQRYAGSVDSRRASHVGFIHTSSSGPVTTRIHAAAICCPMESRLIHSILDNIPGVLSVEVMVVTKTVAVHHAPTAISPAALVAALNSAGLQASLHKHSTGGGAHTVASGGGQKVCSSSCCGSALPTSHIWHGASGVRQQPLFGKLLAAMQGHPSVPPLSIVVSGLLLLVNLLLLLPGIAAPYLLAKGLLALVAAAIAVPPVMKKAWAGLRNRNLDMNSLVIVALCGAIGLGDWFEAGALVVLFTLAEWLEDRCVQRAAGAMEEILALQPEEALVVVEPPDVKKHLAHQEGVHGHSRVSESEEVQEQPDSHAACAGDAKKQAQEPAGHSFMVCGDPKSQCCRATDCCKHEHSSVNEPQHCAEAQQQLSGPCQHVPGTHHSSQHACAGATCSNQHQAAHTVHSSSCSADQDHKHSTCGGNSCHHTPTAAAGADDKAVRAGVSGLHTHADHDGPCCHHAADGRGQQQPHKDQHQQGVHCHASKGCDHHHHHNQQQQHHHHHHHNHQVHSEHVHVAGCCGGSHDTALHTHASKCSQECSDAPVACGNSKNHHHQEPQQQHTLPLRPVPVAQLQVGALVLVRPGDKVPVDGSIEAGSSVLDESMITGESKPVTKTCGDAVLAGTINCGSVALRVRATSAAADSTVARLGALMEAAAASKSRHDAAVELFARYYTPAIVVTALLVAALGSALQPQQWRHWTYLSLVVLVTGCPCALVISTPVATVASLTRAAKKGVLVKGGRPLELLGSLSAASFDKSGTLTEGHFQLIKVHTFASCSRQQALRLAAVLEQHSNHPIAHAIVGAAAASGCMSADRALGAVHVTEVAGKGLCGSVAGQTVLVGSWAYAQECIAAAAAEAAAMAHETQQHSRQEWLQKQQQHDDTMAEAKRLLSSTETENCTVVSLVVDKQLAALLLLSDRARSDALAAVQQLQQLGVSCLMMTGDTMGAAAHVAAQLGMDPDDVCAELLPQEKLELIGRLRVRLAAERKSKQQSQHSSFRGPLASLRQRFRPGSSSRNNSSAYCSSCGEGAAECSCCVALGPHSSSDVPGTQASRGFKGTSSSGMYIDATAGQRHITNSTRSSESKLVQGVVIAHIGDGINDAPALAGADVGVAMGAAGAALAVDAADVALFNNNLTSLPFAVRLGRRLRWVVAANTVFACSIKVAVLAAAAGGVASLWLSLLADVGSSLLVTLHALTLLRFESASDASGSSGALYSSKLSGIRLPHDVHPPHGTGLHHSPADSLNVGAPAPLPALQRLRHLFSLLPGMSWLQPYAKLDKASCAAPAGVPPSTSS